MVNIDRFQRNFLVMIFILALLLGLVLSYHANVQVWILVLPLLVLLVWRSNLITLLIIIFAVFFGDWFIELNILPHQFMWVLEFFVVLLFAKALVNRLIRRRRVDFMGGWFIFGFLTVCFVSFYINSPGVLNLLLFLRLILIAYLLMVAVSNLEISEKQKKILLYVLLGLIIIQLPVAVVKMSIYGQGEQAIGTYAYQGGTQSTALPLIVIGFGLAFFLVYRKSLLFIGLVLGAIAFAIIGGKRGFIFFLPIVIIYVSWHMRNDIKNFFKYAAIAGGIFLLAFYFALSFVPTLSPSGELGTRFDPSYALSFATDYTTKQEDGLSWGRTSSNINVFKNLYADGALSFLFGKGPGSAMKSRFEEADTRSKIMEEFGVGYGITGIGMMAMNVGYLGYLFIFLVLFSIMRKSAIYYRKETNPFWRSFGLSMAVFSFVMIVIELIYAPLLLLGLIPINYFLLSGILFLKNRERQET